MSDEYKQLGNAALKAGNFDEAIGHYTEGIEVDSKNHVLFSNRSAAFASKKDYNAALVDAEKCIELKADWAKGYGRKGAALYGAGDFVAAKLAYEEGLKVDPDSAMLQGGARDADSQIKAQMDRQNSGGGGAQMLQMMQAFAAPDALDKIAANPKTAPYLADPAFMARFKAIQANPSSLQQNMDEKIIMCMMVLLGQGDVLSGVEEDAEAAAEAERRAAEEEEARATEAKRKAEAEAKRKAEEEAKRKAEEEAAKDPKAVEAAAEKAAGTECYKKKDFEGALSHYRKAFELEPTNMVYLLNVGAVYMEQKNFDAAIAECTRAVEVGQDNRGDFKLLARAFARIAKAHFLKGDLEEAIRFYDRSLSNARLPPVMAEKKKVLAALKEKERLAYIDPAKSLEAKERGNALFKNGDFPGSIKEYTEAIKRNPEDAKLYSNRASSYIKLVEPTLALEDAEKCIKLEPEFLKGHVRKGQALLAMKKRTEAQAAFEAAAKIDANHPEVKQGLQRCATYNYGATAGMSRQQRAEQAMQDPEIQAIMSDPVMQSILQQMQADPSALQEHMKDPAIAAKIQTLFQAGIIGAG